MPESLLNLIQNTTPETPLRGSGKTNLVRFVDGTGKWQSIWAAGQRDGATNFREGISGRHKANRRTRAPRKSAANPGRVLELPAELEWIDDGKSDLDLRFQAKSGDETAPLFNLKMKLKPKS